MAWAGAIAVGFVLLGGYDNSPGATRTSPANWPGNDVIPLARSGATLLLFVHPRCPCTRASLGELEKLVAHGYGRVTPWVVVYKAAASDENWDHTDLWHTAAAIPGAHVVRDVDGALARRFGALTSGQTELYDSSGKLIFSGGITFARGHAGDNAGRTAIESYLAGQTPGCRQTPVFGCPIAVSSQESQETP